MIGMCPHCGKVFDGMMEFLIPAHELEGSGHYTPAYVAGGEIVAADGELSQECPGSGQYPRNPLTDNRPLWKDEPVGAVLPQKGDAAQ